MVPFAILGSQAGLEIVHPMAVVILGGLVSATLVTLVVTPVAYMRFASGSQSADNDDLDDSPVGASPDVAQAGAVFIAPARAANGDGDGDGDAAIEHERAAPGPPSPATLAVTEPGTDKPPRAG
jgi:hypothetical protein